MKIRDNPIEGSSQYFIKTKTLEQRLIGLTD